MMDSEYQDLENDADNDAIDESKHAILIQQISALEKKQSIQKPTRSEAAREISEFALTKAAEGRKPAVSLSSLIKSLPESRTVKKIKQRLIGISKKEKTLRKPLEKIYADKAERKFAYEKVTKSLDRWDAIVERNRSLPHMSFPLKHVGTLGQNQLKEKKIALKSDLLKELEALEPPKEVTKPQPYYKMSLEEMIQHRKEAAKLRAMQSYRAAKDARQNKIKSKKYHRILRKENMKKQLAEFENLQQSNPEAALQKLDELERSRALERISLRHKSTGKWAKNKQILAKYDKESRQALAEQLALSRQLTQKLKDQNSSDSETEEVEAVAKPIQSNNPWIGGVKTDQEVADFVTSYRNYWDEINRKEKEGTLTQEEIKQIDCLKETAKKKPMANTNAMKEMEVEVPSIEKSIEEDSNEEEISTTSVVEEKKIKKVSPAKQKLPGKPNKKGSIKKEKKKSLTESRALKNLKAEKSSLKAKKNRKTDLNFWIEEIIEDTGNAEESSKNSVAKKTKVSPAKAKLLQKVDRSVATSKEKKKSLAEKREVQRNVNSDKNQITDLELSVEINEINSENVNEIFEDLEDLIECKKKKNANMKELKPKKKRQLIRKSEKNEERNTPDLSFPMKTNRPIIDEELNCGEESSEQDIRKLAASLEEPKNKETSDSAPNDIDPSKYMTIKATNLISEIPDSVVFGENEEDEEDESQKQAIAEAFEDDDVVEEFRKEKEDDIEKNRPQDIDLFLPGWGSWGGQGIEASARKRKRFIISVPKDAPRKDQNKGNLIINEHKEANVRKHQVSELPFPFRTVKDFEASIRAPIGNTFVTETAYRKFIRPAVKTKMGTIIKPMDEDYLLASKKS